jgi:hypothetical protein
MVWDIKISFLPFLAFCACFGVVHVFECMHDYYRETRRFCKKIVLDFFDNPNHSCERAVYSLIKELDYLLNN